MRRNFSTSISGSPLCIVQTAIRHIRSTFQWFEHAFFVGPLVRSNAFSSARKKAGGGRFPLTRERSLVGIVGSSDTSEVCADVGSLSRVTGAVRDKRARARAVCTRLTERTERNDGEETAARIRNCRPSAEDARRKAWKESEGKEEDRYGCQGMVTETRERDRSIGYLDRRIAIYRQPISAPHSNNRAARATRARASLALSWRNKDLLMPLRRQTAARTFSELRLRLPSPLFPRASCGP